MTIYLVTLQEESDGLELTVDVNAYKSKNDAWSAMDAIITAWCENSESECRVEKDEESISASDKTGYIVLTIKEQEL